jgi:hypothetical protein
MTVAELIENLKALPQDMEVMMLDSDRESPVEIIQVSRGTWGADLAEEQEAILDAEYGDNEIPEDVSLGLTDYDTDHFYQDDENGKIAVLVTW